MPNGGPSENEILCYFSGNEDLHLALFTSGSQYTVGMSISWRLLLSKLA